MNSFHRSSSKGESPNSSRLWVLWVGLAISYLGIFLMSVWLTGSLTLFIGFSGKREGFFIGLIGLAILIVGMTVVARVVLGNPNKGK